MHQTPAKITAQIACEYIVNHRREGFDNRTRLAVLDHAMETGVGEFYIECVAEEIQIAAMEADGAFGGAL